MPSWWTCPADGASNSGPRCERCGEDRPPQSRRGEPGEYRRADPERSDEYGRCAWTSPARCRMPVSWRQGPGSGGYCTWHAWTLRSPASDTPEELARFADRLIAGKYCTLWAHYPVDVLWRLCRGEVIDDPPTPCDLSRCLVPTLARRPVHA